MNDQPIYRSNHFTAPVIMNDILRLLKRRYAEEIEDLDTTFQIEDFLTDVENTTKEYIKRVKALRVQQFFHICLQKIGENPFNRVIRKGEFDAVTAKTLAHYHLDNDLDVSAVQVVYSEDPDITFLLYTR